MVNLEFAINRGAVNRGFTVLGFSLLNCLNANLSP